MNHDVFTKCPDLMCAWLTKSWTRLVLDWTRQLEIGNTQFFMGSNESAIVNVLG